MQCMDKYVYNCVYIYIYIIMYTNTYSYTVFVSYTVFCKQFWDLGVSKWFTEVQPKLEVLISVMTRWRQNSASFCESGNPKRIHEGTAGSAAPNLLPARLWDTKIRGQATS